MEDDIKLLAREMSSKVIQSVVDKTNERPFLLQSSSSKRSGGVALVVDEEKSSSGNVNKSSKRSGGVTLVVDEKAAPKKEVVTLVDEEERPVNNKDNKLDFYRRKSKYLEKQLVEQSKRLQEMKEKEEERAKEFIKVSDLLQLLSKQKGAMSPGSQTNLFATIKEIAGVSKNASFQQVELDTFTAQWLDNMFHSQGEGFRLGEEEEEEEGKHDKGEHHHQHEKQDDRSDDDDDDEEEDQDDDLEEDLLAPLSTSSMKLRTSPPPLNKHRKSVHYNAIQTKQSDIQKILENQDEWDVWKLSELQMMANANEMLCNFGMVEAFQVKQTAFQRFFTAIGRLYKKANPYHNFHHGFDVMKTCYFFLEQCQFGRDAPNLSGYSLLIAGLCHDVGHPGTNNLFQVHCGTKLAIRYNDHSVLENHHASLTFKTIRNCNDEIYGNLDKEGRTEMRKIIVESILATDVSQHVKLLKSVNQGSVDDHLLQLKLILCCADVSNPIKPLSISKRWTKLVHEEFYQQGDLERELGLPISPYCDRQQVHTHQISVNFIDFVVNPVMSALQKVYPQHKHKMTLILQILANKRQYFCNQKQKQQQQQTTNNNLIQLEPIITSPTNNKPKTLLKSPPPIPNNTTLEKINRKTRRAYGIITRK